MRTNCGTTEKVSQAKKIKLVLNAIWYSNTDKHNGKRGRRIFAWRDPDRGSWILLR